MAIFKCKMCGGDLNVEEGTSVIECEYCGTTQTVAAVDSEKKVNLFNRANRLRMNSEFDKAGAIYEQIIAEFPEEAEAYWCLCLCNYGIEYVDDPATGKKIPTCHRASFEKLRKDENYNLALEYADAIAAEVYREQAKEIDRIMGEILSISANEKPYDIFICYKETDAKGERTVDSVLAQDIYDTLTDKGYKVFFSRITLEDKLGKLYEPYIFAALNSAKVMLAIGTDYEHYNAVWVRNEWSRFMKLAAADKSKTLIPCFKDMDAYDMPDEFKGMQAQDMGKIGFMQDLCRGIDKLFGREKTAQSAASASPAAATTDSLLKRAFMFLEDGEWDKADDFCEQVLNIDPENAQAYIAKGMAELQVAHRGDIAKKMASLFNESKGMSNDVPTVTLRSYSEEITAIIAIGRITGMRDRRQVTEFVHGDLPKTAAINCSPEVLNEVLESISAKGSVDIVVNEPSERSFSQEDMPEAFKKAIRFGDEKLKAELLGLISETSEQHKNMGLDHQKQIEDVVNAIQAQFRSETMKPRQDKLSAEIAELQKTINDYPMITEKVQSVNAEIKELENQKSLLTKHKSGLGLFKLKEKQETEEKIAETNKKIQELEKEIADYAQILERYPAVDDIHKKLETLQKEAELLADELSCFNNLSMTYGEAMRLLSSDASVKDEIYFDHPEATRYLAKTDHEMYFGRFHQRENNNGQPEPITWVVLAKEEGRILLLSEEGLICKPYNNSESAVDWSSCSLRAWLNDDFLNSAFSEKERELISENGESTKDKVFLLSVNEVKKYVGNHLMKCSPVTAAHRGANWTYNDINGRRIYYYQWWLRTPGRKPGKATYCQGDEIKLSGISVEVKGILVRPALWISLE